ncbi:sensor histidine kinase [Pontiella agarivorans]|uniref:histidine kinase n=1 Tax=Pontiella agarivorans TaxID=3038953 RepID=A0ABU5MVJ1_9BACT|nr:ATP-binding protein [Pontiella agarivorans]MDZ8118239.1 ATP-binding protein [Pontiella agarivorans]
MNMEHKDIERRLEERVKELGCLYAIAQLSGNPATGLEEILQGVAETLPDAWQYPGRAAARIILDGCEFSTGRQSEYRHVLSVPLVVRGKIRGSIEIGYPSSDIPFLKEEKTLLDEVVRQVGLIIDRRETAAEQERLHTKLRHADRLATIGRLAAGVAHELNEPLGGILGFSQLLAKTPGLPKQAQSDIAKIEAATLHARGIIRNLMTFARQTPPRDVEINLNRLIKESESIWKPRCAASNIQHEYVFDETIPEIVADAGQLRQVVTNLIVNAIQAMPDGGTLRISTSRDGRHWLRLTVADTGDGIEPELLPRIFDPFFTTKDVDEGTGLGLSVVHGIITGHNGTIALESTPGRGTQAVVRLPLRRPPPPGEPHGQN